jgi:hypothetical protein
VDSQNEVFGRIFAALGIAVMLMYLILVLQFGSFIEPLAILVSLPLSLVGVMLALMITGSTINIMSLIGVILLMESWRRTRSCSSISQSGRESTTVAAARGDHSGRRDSSASDHDDDACTDRGNDSRCTRHG